VETYAELFDHWKNYTSTTSSSINVGAGLTLAHLGISGSFSDESESIRSHQVNDKSVTTRVQVRYVRYTAKLQPDTPLHPSFSAGSSSNFAF
jgi:L-fucose isomerase-like protein